MKPLSILKKCFGELTDYLFLEQAFQGVDAILHIASISLRDMLSEIGKCLGKRVRFISCPFPIAYAGVWILYWMTLKKKDYREKVQRLCEPRVYSHDDATRDFGYAPRSFQVGIVDEVEEYKAHRA